MRSGRVARQGAFLLTLGRVPKADGAVVMADGQKPKVGTESGCRHEFPVRVEGVFPIADFGPARHIPHLDEILLEIYSGQTLAVGPARQSVPGSLPRESMHFLAQAHVP